MTSKVRITPRALEDLKTIGRYTLRQWGREQRDTYLRGVDRRITWLADHPALGRRRTDIAPGYRCFAHEAHLIFYLIREGGIDIIGVPHQAMDIPDHFTPDESGDDEGPYMA
jgi:toxin ParE1/3/4